MSSSIDKGFETDEQDAVKMKHVQIDYDIYIFIWNVKFIKSHNVCSTNEQICLFESNHSCVIHSGWGDCMDKCDDLIC